MKHGNGGHPSPIQELALASLFSKSWQICFGSSGGLFSFLPKLNKNFLANVINPLSHCVLLSPQILLKRFGIKSLTKGGTQLTKLPDWISGINFPPIDFKSSSVSDIRSTVPTIAIILLPQSSAGWNGVPLTSPVVPSSVTSSDTAESARASSNCSSTSGSSATS